MNHAAFVGDGRINTEAAEHILGSSRVHRLDHGDLVALANGGTSPTTGITIITGTTAAGGLVLPSPSDFPELREGDTATVINKGTNSVNVRAVRKNGSGNTETWAIDAGKMADFDYRHGQWRKLYY